jgi:hypothetical protein
VTIYFLAMAVVGGVTLAVAVFGLITVLLERK